jgi:hypothetical protein
MATSLKPLIDFMKTQTPEEREICVQMGFGALPRFFILDGVPVLLVNDKRVEIESMKCTSCKNEIKSRLAWAYKN